jgi:hypothetical protein
MLLRKTGNEDSRFIQKLPHYFHAALTAVTVLHIAGIQREFMYLQVLSIQSTVGNTKVTFCYMNHMCIKSSVVWGVTQCNLLKGIQHFRGMCRLHLQGQRIS